MKTILTIFAGRYKYLSILRNYLDYLLDNDILTEVHLWNYARCDWDYNYIINITKSNQKYKLFSPKKESIKKKWNQWAEYYDFYTNYDDFDVLIKCDDDIVYIDINKISEFLSEIDPNKSSLYFPNIINNDVCAYIQTVNNVHDLLPDIDINYMQAGCTIPLTGWEGWFKQTEKAHHIHKLFLEDRNKFIINKPNISWDSRISINMFAGTKKIIQNYFSLFKHIGNGDDEAFFSSVICKYKNTTNYIIPYFNVVHFSFGPQLTDELDEEFVNKYYKLSQDITKSRKNILFLMTGSNENNRNGVVNGINVRTKGVGCSGVETSMISLAEYLAKNKNKVYIANNNKNNFDIINDVHYIDYNLDNTDTKHFDYIITFPWIDETLNKIPIMGTLNAFIMWMQTIAINNVDLVNEFIKKYGSDFQVVAPSKYITKLLNPNIKTSNLIMSTMPIPNMPININIQPKLNKQKHKIIFHTCWERGGHYALNIFKRLNDKWHDGTFCCFDYDTSSGNKIVDKQELYNELATSEYFIYPLLNHKINAIHKPVFSMAITEALMHNVIVITLPILAIKESFGNKVIYTENNNNMEIYNNYNITMNKDEYNKLNNDIVTLFTSKIEEIENNKKIDLPTHWYA